MPNMIDQLSQGMRELEFLSRLARATNRRRFLQWSGVTIAVAAAGCGDDDDEGGDITAPGDVSAANSNADVPEQVAPGDEVTILVQARDSAGADLTVGGSEVVINVTGTNPAGPIEATDNGDGTYEGRYEALEEGTDSVEITLDGSGIGGSPYTVLVVAEAGAVSLGSGDTGILNYAFALEQLEAAFYAAVLEAPYVGITAEETQILTEIRDHEIIHREFLRAALADRAITDLTVDFTTVDFTSRDSVLATASSFEDLGVSAYNGAGFLLDDTEFLLAAGKIASVEARHAAVIRDLIAPGTNFAGDDVVNERGLDRLALPDAVLPSTAGFITTPIDASELPRT